MPLAGEQPAPRRPEPAQAPSTVRPEMPLAATGPVVQRQAEATAGEIQPPAKPSEPDRVRMRPVESDGTRPPESKPTWAEESRPSATITPTPAEPLPGPEAAQEMPLAIAKPPEKVVEAEIKPVKMAQPSRPLVTTAPAPEPGSEKAEMPLVKVETGNAWQPMGQLRATSRTPVTPQQQSGSLIQANLHRKCPGPHHQCRYQRWNQDRPGFRANRLTCAGR